jgi:hypothetical protein
MGRCTELGMKGDLEQAVSVLVLHDGVWVLKARWPKRGWWCQCLSSALRWLRVTSLCSMCPSSCHYSTTTQTHCDGSRAAASEIKREVNEGMVMEQARIRSRTFRIRSPYRGKVKCQVRQQPGSDLYQCRWATMIPGRGRVDETPCLWRRA